LLTQVLTRINEKGMFINLYSKLYVFVC